MKGFSNPVTIRGSLSATLMTAGLLALVGGLVIYGWYNPYTRKVTTPGFVAPTSGNVEVRSPSSGLARLHARNGDKVAKGDLLAVITDTLDTDQEASDIDLQLTALRSKLELVAERIDLSERRIESAASNYTLRAETARNQSASSASILEMQSRGNHLAETASDRAKRLYEKGLVTQTALEEAGIRLLEANQRLIDAEATAMLAHEEVQITQIDHRIELNRLEEELIGYRTEQLTMKNEISRLEAEREREVRAPVDGTVTVAAIRDLERVQAEEPMFLVDPSNDDYVATLLAPSSAIGFIEMGDEVGIRYEAYPYREHGIFTGTVTEIDATAQLASALGAPGEQSEPVYRIQADIEQKPVGKSGEPLRLVSGMLFEASITVDEKPILFWLLDPVL